MPDRLPVITSYSIHYTKLYDAGGADEQNAFRQPRTEALGGVSILQERHDLGELFFGFV